MLKTKLKKIIIPSRIITNKKSTIGADQKGIIYSNYEELKDIYQIFLDEPNENAHTFKGIINSKRGIFLKQSEFDVVPIEKPMDRFNLMQEYKFINNIIINGKKKTEALEYAIKSHKENLKYYQKELKNRGKMLKQDIVKLKNFKESLDGKPESFDNQYEKIIKHPKIDNIQIVDNYIIVTTKDLTYHDGKIPDFILGAYHIFIPFNAISKNEIKIINYKRQYNLGHLFHPCVKEEGVVCTGDQLAYEINNFLKENQIAFLVFDYINFLENPNYGSPYIQANKFRASQDVSFKPKNILDYLKQSEWQAHEKWDNKKYYKDLILFWEKDLKIEQAKKIPNPDKINLINNEITSAQSSLNSYENYN